MKLYRKKLDSLEALKREQLRLRYESKKTDFGDLLPSPDLKSLGALLSSQNGWLSIITELLSAKSEAQFISALAVPLLKAWNKNRSRKRREKEASGAVPKPPFLKRAMREIVIGYVVGKAVMMGLSGIKALRKRRKAMHDEEE